MAKADWSRLSPEAITGAVAGVALVVYSGPNLIFPIALSGLAWLILRNLAPSAKRPVVPVLALQAGQLGWFILGAALSPAALVQILPDIVILAGLLAWLYLIPSRPAAWTLIAYHVVSLAVHLWRFVHNPVASGADRALAVHMAWRVAAIVLLALFLRRQALPDPAATARTFE